VCGGTVGRSALHIPHALRTSNGAIAVASWMRTLAALMVSLMLLTTVVFAHAIVASGDDGRAPVTSPVGRGPAQIGGR
jgi:hypothetical protein